MKNENFGANLWGNFCSMSRNKNFRFGSKFGPNNLRTLKTYKKEEDLYKNITQPPNQESQFLAPKSQSKWCHRRVNIPPPKNLRTLSKSPLCDKCERFAYRNTEGGGHWRPPDYKNEKCEHFRIVSRNIVRVLCEQRESQEAQEHQSGVSRFALAKVHV